MRRKIYRITGFSLFALAMILVVYVAISSFIQQTTSAYVVNELHITIKFWKELIAIILCISLGLKMLGKNN